MKSGVTVTDASHIISGYKARTSNGTLVTGNNAGYSSGYNDGVAQGHADRDAGVTVSDASHIISGYKARNSNGTLLTGTDAGYNAGVTQGHVDRDTGVTITDASHILSGYKGRNSSGTLLTGTAETGRPVSAAYVTEKAYRTGSGSITFSSTPGYTYAVVFGGDNGDKCSDATVNGGTKLAFRSCYTDHEGVAIVIVSATSSSVTVTNNTGYPYQGATIVMRVTQ